jgi:hypothetical protein
MPAPVAGAPSPLRFAQPGSLSAALRAAGFEQVEENSLQLVFPWPGSVDGWVGSIPEISLTFHRLMANIPAEQITAIVAEMRAAAEPYTDAQGVNFPGVVHIGSGVRPSAESRR